MGEQTPNAKETAGSKEDKSVTHISNKDEEGGEDDEGEVIEELVAAPNQKSSLFSRLKKSYNYVRGSESSRGAKGNYQVLSDSTSF